MKSVLISELAAMDEEQREKVLAELVAEAKKPTTQEDLDRVRKMLESFETRAGMTTAQMREGANAGTVPETSEINEWLFVANVYDRISKRFQDGV